MRLSNGLANQIRVNFVCDNRMTRETNPRLGGRAFRKRRLFHES